MAILGFNFKWRTRISEHKKHGVHNSSLTRIDRLLMLLSMYIWIAILFCCVHLGAAQTTTPSVNMTSNENMTTVELTTIAEVTNLMDVTTDLTTESSGDDPKGWIFGVIAAGVVILIVIIIIIIICVKKRCRCRRTPPTPVGQDRDNTYNRGYTDDNQGDIRLEMDPRASGIEDDIYQNTAFPSQVNPAFDHSQPVHSLDDDFPSMPPPAPPRGASSNIDLDTRPALVIPSPRSPTLPSPGPMSPASPLDDIPDRLPPAVPTPGLKDIRAELNDKFKDVAPPDKKTKKKKEKKKEKKEDKPKSPKRKVDANEQVRGEVPMQPTHNLDAARPKPNILPRFDFKDYSPQQEDGADFGGNYEEMSPVQSSPADAWSPRQQEEGDFGGEYEDIDGDGSEDYDDEYEDVDPNAKPVKPLGTKQAIPMPHKLPGQRGVANLNQRPMVPPPKTSEDFGGEYEVVVSPSEEPKRRLPGRNIDHRQRVSIPSHDEEQDHGGVYEDVAYPTVSPKRKPQGHKPKTPKKSPKPLPGDDFGQEYGNTGNRTMFPATTTQRRPPTLPSSSNWHQEEEEDDDWFPPPPPPPGLDQRSPVQSPGQDYGAEYDNIEIKPTIKKKPPVPKPKVAKKPSNSGGSSTLPVNPKQQLSPPFEAQSSATLPLSGGHELIEEGEEDSFYENLEGVKGKLSMHYQNLPTTEKPQEQISSSGYSIFSERPR